MTESHTRPFRQRLQQRPNLLSLTLAALVALFLAACGGSPDVADTDAPLDGRPASKPGQLVGTWMQASAGPFAGFEFQKNGSVIATSSRGVLTLQYSLLDGGRLSLVETSGRTTLYQTQLASAALELTPENTSPGATPLRFLRVKDGQPLAAALQERAANLAAARERRSVEIAKLLAAPDLVLAKSSEQGPTAVIALQIDSPQSRFTGAATMIENPANINPLAPVRVHPIQGELRPADEFTDRMLLTIDLGPAQSPRGQQKYRGRVTLTFDGPIDSPSATGPAEFPESWIGQADFALRRDASLHKSTLAHLAAQNEAAKQAIAKTSSPLGGRAVLTGHKTISGTGQTEPVELTIERAGETDTFTARVSVGRLSDAAATAEVELLLGAGALYLNLPNNEQWRLQLDDSGSTYAGLWRPNTRSDFLGHGQVTLQLGRVWTIAQVKAEREAMARFLAQDLLQPIQFTGFVDVGRPDAPERWPVWVELQTQPNGAAAGRAWLLGQSLGVELGGTLSGNSFNLNTTAAMPGSAASRALAQQRWQLTLEGIDPQPRLAGRMNGTIGGGGPVQIAQLVPKTNAALQAATLDALDGKAFAVVNTTISRRLEPSYFRFQLDRPTGRVTGDAIGYDLTGRNPSAYPPGLISGELVEDRGHTLLKLSVEGSPEPVRGREGERFDFTLAPTLDEDGILSFFGWGPVGPGNQTWLTLSPADPGAANTVAPEQALRLAAQKLGAKAAPPANPQPGDSTIVIVSVTERDAKVGQLFYADGKYTHRNSVPAAAIHAGLAQPGEVCIIRLTYGPPFTEPVEPVTQNGVASQRGTFRPNNTLPTFSLERLTAH